MKKITLKSQFYTGAASILFIFCIVASLIEYRLLHRQLEITVSSNASNFLETAAAIRAYAKDTLRPKITDLVSSDRFVVEAMSTSYISREIMKNLQERFPRFVYKRAAGDPRNPLNMADDFEQKMISVFNSKSRTTKWGGYVEKGNKSYYACLMPIYVEQECLKCHGDPGDAPVELRQRYGMDASYGYKVGDVVAADTIYIPMSGYNVQIKEKAWWVFTIGFLSLFSLLVLFYFLFNRTVIKRLRGLIHTFSGIPGSDKSHPAIQEVKSGDEIEQLAGAFEDVADYLKVAHEELKTSEFKYRRLFETFPNAIFICDSRTRLTHLNEAGIHLFKFENHEEACAIESFYLLFWDGREAARIFEKVKHEGGLLDTEVQMVNRFGHRMDVILTANRLADDRGIFSGFEAVIRDITEQKKMDNYLAQTEKLASIGQLAAGVAHEINNPLGVISCYSTLIEKSAADDKQITEDIGVIIKHTQSCKKVVDSLLSFARVSEPNKNKINIQNSIDEILSVLKYQMQKKNIEFVTDYCCDLIEVTVDSDKIRQVFMNLAMNAIQAMPDGGRIAVRTSVDRDFLKIEFKDSGTGIHKKDIGRIFEPFFTTKKAGDGTGLGLSISYGIVKQHGGELQVQSVIGEGTVFTVLLPLEH